MIESSNGEKLTLASLDAALDQIKDMPERNLTYVHDANKLGEPWKPLGYIESQRLSRRYTRILGAIADHFGTHDPRKWNINKYYKHMRRKNLVWSEKINDKS